jgi:N utilization substance protein B
MDITDSSPDEAIPLHCELMLTGEENQSPTSILVSPFAEHLVRGVHMHRDEIDQIIVSASENWRIDRMSIVDRNILRIALFEMLYCPDVPPKASINEAIDIGKKFGSQDSGSFINGILDHVLERISKTDPILIHSHE